MGSLRYFITALACVVVAMIMLIDWLDARLYMGRHRTAWVLVHMMYFAFGVLLVVVGIVRDWWSKGRDLTVTPQSEDDRTAANGSAYTGQP